jgi:hypothetical protein
MKSCRVRLDRLTGVVEMEAPEDVKVGDHVVGEIDKGACLGVVISEPAETRKEGLKKIARKATDAEVSDYVI